MSWQLGAFGLLAVALLGGFAWYERERPDARIVALVGTLAAFAALGRIAFAAVPNVKPTTDIVLISGYAIGGGPGFAVGALAGLTSNFFFGQGPWTPWQMAAWGATGVIGALLAWLTSPAMRARLSLGRSRSVPEAAGEQPWIGRWPLAIVCCVVGFAFTAVQDVGDWVNYSDHSAAALGVYVGKGLGFDAIHAAGCFAFALALGPALTHSIQRFARRLQVTWLPSGTTALLVAVAIAGSLAVGLRGASPARAANGATGPVSYLLHAQNRDGGFGAAAGQPSNQLYSGWAALGLASAGYRLADVAAGPRSVISYVGSGAAGNEDVGSLERTILVVSAAGLRAASFDGHDLTAALERRIGADGSVSGQVNHTTFAVLALRSAGVAVRARTLHWLLADQNSDGGFGFAAGAQSDVDDTGATLEALAGVVGSRAVTMRERAVAYLRRRQDSDGGFPSQPGEDSNAQSTAWAVQGLLAAGTDPAALHRRGAISPLAYLRGLIGAHGSVSYARGNHETPVWVTGEVLMALELKPLPLRAPAIRPAQHAARRRRPRQPMPELHRPAVRGPERRVVGAISGGSLSRLAAGVGLVTAVVLAPLGLG